MAKHSQAEKAKELKWLHDHLKPGDTVYTILTHVSPSGMSRDIEVVLIKVGDDGQPYTLHPNYAVEVVLDLPRSKRDHGDGVRVAGCGMDMGYHLVFMLGQALWPDGTPEPHGTRNGKPDRTGGYALRHRWL
jgi:hypothetical protein